MCCDDLSTLVDTDYHVEIYKYGIEWDWKSGTGAITFTGNKLEATPLCDECLSGVLSRAGISEEYYHNNFC